jgi:hypothetical protein
MVVPLVGAGAAELFEVGVAAATVAVLEPLLAPVLLVFWLEPFVDVVFPISNCRIDNISRDDDF